MLYSAAFIFLLHIFIPPTRTHVTLYLITEIKPYSLGNKVQIQLQRMMMFEIQNASHTRVIDFRNAPRGRNFFIFFIVDDRLTAVFY